MKETAVCVLITQGDKILGVSRRDDPQKWGLPGGKVEAGETEEEAAHRELKEETGFTAQRLLPIYIDVCGKWKVVTFHAEGLEKVTEPQENEGLVRWVTWEDLLSGPFATYNSRLKASREFRDKSVDKEVS